MDVAAPSSTAPANKRQQLLGDLFGGCASMLVALPSAIAFGIIIFAPLGNGWAARGALAGIVGTVVMGLVAPLVGGTSRLVSAPCAPAAALLSIFAADLVAGHTVPIEAIPLYLALAGFGAGLIQVLAGLARGGTFIKYIPYPVVSGYLSGVGVLIFLSQLPRFLGLGKETSLANGLLHPAFWNWQNMLIGTITVAVMLGAPKIIKSVPASIAALAAGVASYFALVPFNKELLALENNAMVIGRISAAPSDLFANISANFTAIPAIDLSTLSLLLAPVISLGVLLSMDTLKTCVVLDVLTGSRHNSNRELFGQGVANITNSFLGGVPGAGTMGGTLVNIYSGGQTRLSGIIEGASSLAVLLLLARFIAWIPVASLAGVLLVVGVRMVDRKSFQLLKSRSTVFDFLVILAVVIAAVTTSLITAAGVGIALAIVLFLRDQIRFPVVRRLVFGNRIFSRKSRAPSEQDILAEQGSQVLLAELQGQLFFGTTDQLYTMIEPNIGSCRYFIFDMRRVQAVDFTAANMLSQLKRKIAERGGQLAFASVPRSLPTGQNVRSYLEKLGFTEHESQVRFFPDEDEALEWAEDALIEEYMPERAHRQALDLFEFDFFKGISPHALNTLGSYMQAAHIDPAEKIFSINDTGREIYFIRKGNVRIELPLDNGTAHHLATFSRGAFFGDMAFLDNQPRSADARAEAQVELYVLDRRTFDHIMIQHPDVAGIFFERLALEIARRLRINVSEMKVLQEG